LFLERGFFGFGGVVRVFSDEHIDPRHDSVAHDEHEPHPISTKIDTLRKRKAKKEKKKKNSTSYAQDCGDKGSEKRDESEWAGVKVGRELKDARIERFIFENLEID
jgi:hypothetical protein